MKRKRVTGLVGAATLRALPEITAVLDPGAAYIATATAEPVGWTLPIKPVVDR